MRTSKVRRMLIAGVAAGLLTLSGAGTALAHDTPPEGEQEGCVSAPEDSSHDETAHNNECGER